MVRVENASVDVRLRGEVYNSPRFFLFENPFDERSIANIPLHEAVVLASEIRGIFKITSISEFIQIDDAIATLGA